MISWPDATMRPHRTELVGTQKWSRTTRFYPQEQTGEDISRKLPNEISTNRLWLAGKCVAGSGDPTVRSGE